MGSLAEDLRKVVRGTVEDSSEVLDAYSRDASLFVVRPEVVARAADEKDVVNLVRAVSAKKSAGENVSITARAAGTDMSGGPLGASVVLDTLALNKFLKFESGTSAAGEEEGYAVAEPGMYFRDFDRETKKKNLELPSYPASREICTIGGMVANDSGGEKNLKYGKTARYVEELDVVLADGEVHTLRKLEGKALDEKLTEKSFEGDVYRGIAKIVRENEEVIRAAKPHVEKNSSGYALWDIGDGITSLNLARLFTGSQGALGVITKIRFKLVRPKTASSMVVVFLKNIDSLGAIIPETLKHHPDSFESYDDQTFALATKYFPELALQMKAGIISLSFAFLPELWMLATGGVPKLVLMVEFRSDTQEDALESARALASSLKPLVGAGSIHIAKNERAARKYWAIRRESFNLLRGKVRGMRTAPFIDDFVVPPSSLAEFLPKLRRVLDEYDLIYTVAGHVGDGNFHIIPLIDPKRGDARQIIDELSHKVADLVLSYKGSLSGEHNDGLLRTPYAKQMFGPDMHKLFEKVEALFDPQNIFNPGKKVGTTFSESAKRLDLPLS